MNMRVGFILYNKVKGKVFMENLQKEKCKHFQKCSAALCPLDINPKHYWYADTEICRSTSTPAWVKTQRKIQKVNPDPHRYYTVKMLQSISRIHNIVGIESIGYNKQLEEGWIIRRKDRHKIIHQDQLSSIPNKFCGGKSRINITQSLVETFKTMEE